MRPLIKQRIEYVYIVRNAAKLLQPHRKMQEMILEIRYTIGINHVRTVDLQHGLLSSLVVLLLLENGRCFCKRI